MGNPGGFVDISGNIPSVVKKLVLYSKGTGRSPILYAATYEGVFRTKALSGATTAWTIFGTGLPDTDIWDLQINPVNHWLYVATYGRGVWNTIDLDQMR
jgi:hypothetical protein